MPSVTLKREEGETDEEYRQRLDEHEEQVYRAEERLLRIRQAAEKKWGKR